MIYFLGDVHSQFDHVLPAIQKRGTTDASVVFLGDIEPQKPFEEEIRPLVDAGIGVWFIHGNHDTDSRKSWENLEGSWHRNLHGRVVEIEGIRMAGLGGVFRGEIWYPDGAKSDSVDPPHRSYQDYTQFIHSTMALKRRLSKQDLVQLEAVPTSQWQGALLDLSKQGKLLKHKSSIFPKDYNALGDLKADILVTHEAPSCHPHGFDAIDCLAHVMGAKCLFHGHHHDSLDYRAWDAELGFAAYGVGFRGIMDLNGNRVLAGDFDEARLYRETHPIAGRHHDGS